MTQTQFLKYNPFVPLFVISFISALFVAIPAIAMDYLLGHVISVDQQNNCFVLQIDQVVDEPFHGEASIASQQHNVSAVEKDEPQLISVIVSEEAEMPFLPGCVRDGELVRVWGENVGGEESDFQAVDIQEQGAGVKISPVSVPGLEGDAVSGKRGLAAGLLEGKAGKSGVGV